MEEVFNSHSFGFDTGKNDIYFILNAEDFKNQLREIKKNSNYLCSSNLLVDLLISGFIILILFI